MAFTTGISKLLSSVDQREKRKLKSPPIADQKAHAETKRKRAEKKKEEQVDE